MGKRKGKRGNKAKPNTNGAPSPWGDVQLGGLRLTFPKPRLPSLLGSAHNLRAGQTIYPRVDLDLPYVGSQYAVVGGALAQSIPIDKTNVALFATRFGATFGEYAIVGARFEIRTQGPVAAQQGFYTVTIDEKSAASPTSAVLDQARLDVLISTTESPNVHVINWKPVDYLDLDWTPIGTTYTPAWLKLFASNANTFTGASTTASVVVTGAIAFCFRGYV